MSVTKTEIGTGMTVRDEIHVNVEGGVGPEEEAAWAGMFGSAAADPVAMVRTICEEIAGDRRGNPQVDSEQWYAVKVLEHLDTAEAQRGLGRHEDAERWAFQAGLTIGIAAMKFEWESVTKTGARVLIGTKKGLLKRYGTQKERDAWYAELQAAVDKTRKRNQTASKAEVRRIVSKETGASDSTLRRHTIDPGRK